MTQQAQKQDGKDGFASAIQTVFDRFQHRVDKLDEIPGKAATAVSLLWKVMQGDIFALPRLFYETLDELSDVEGFVQQTVLEIELQRERIRNPRTLIEETQKQDKIAETMKVPQQVFVQTATEPVKSSPGWTGYLSERLRMGVLRDALQKNSMSPVITTPQKVSDVLDYGRDITREYNKLVDYFRGCLAHLKVYPNNLETKDFFFEEIRAYLVKLSNIIKSFSRAITEYRKELVGEREEAYGRALTMLEQAKYMADAQARPTSLADYYRMARMQAGAQDVGE